MTLTVDQALQQGVAAHKEGKLQEAERLYRSILRSLPKHPDANHNLGVLAVSLNKSEAALPLFKTALDANPNQAQFWLSYINALIKENQFEDAKQAIEQGKKKGLTGDKVETLEKQLSVSLANLDEKQSKQNEFSPAIELREVGKYQEAQEWLSRFIESHSNDPEALSLLSQVLLLDKKDAESEKVLLTAASINSELPSIYRNQARLFLKQSKPAEALKKAQSGYERSFDDPESWLVLAACLGANQRDLEALPLIEKALQARPNYAEAFANRMLIRLRAKNIVGAIKDAEMAVSLKPHLTEVWGLLGSLRYQSHNLSGAIEALKKAHELDSTNVNFMIDLGEFLRQENKAAEAITIIELATKLEPDNANAWLNLGVAFQQDKKIDNAKMAYEKALVINPKLAEGLSNLGALATEARDWNSALQYFEKALEIKPGFAEAHNNLGNTLRKLGRLEEAEASLRQAIGLKADYAAAHSNLGNTLQELGRLEEAEASLRQAIALKSDFTEGYYNLGILLFESGQYKKAVDQFKLCGDSESENYLLRCFYQQDKRSLFCDQLDRLISQNTINAVIGSFTSRAEIRYQIKRSNPFAEYPLEYVLKTDLTEQYDFKNIFVKTVKDILNDDSVSYRKQSLLSHGRQTSGNVFAENSNSMGELKKIIHSEIERYRALFQASEEGVLRNWPTNYDLKGWLVSMSCGGELTAHIHPRGWISGSVYINVPKKLKADSGNLVVCIDDEKPVAKTPANLTESIDVVTGNLVLFPASLMHYTIPFESEDERVVLAFDVIPA